MLGGFGDEIGWLDWLAPWISMCDELGHYITTYMSSILKDERWEGFNKVGLANKKVARQLGRVAMKARRSRVQLRSIIIDQSNTVGSSTQPCGIATRITWT
jgi:hypothetical protein